MKKLMLIAFLAFTLFAQDEKMQVFKPYSSTCPKSWYEEMKDVAKEVDVVTLMSTKGIKKDVGIPFELQSCNTSFLNDFVFEGNVPPKAIKDFLKTKPKNAIGLALPSSQNDKNPKTVFIIFEDKTYKEFGKY